MRCGCLCAGVKVQVPEKVKKALTDGLSAKLEVSTLKANLPTVVPIYIPDGRVDVIFQKLTTHRQRIILRRRLIRQRSSFRKGKEGEDEDAHKKPK
ncbi:hypothetical protein Esti_001219 [Eimeria stiedai]